MMGINVENIRCLEEYIFCLQVLTHEKSQHTMEAGTSPLDIITSPLPNMHSLDSHHLGGLHILTGARQATQFDLKFSVCLFNKVSGAF